MGTTLNRHAYQRLINEDLEWLDRQPRSLEREHIKDIVRLSPDREYTRTSTSAAAQRAAKRIADDLFRDGSGVEAHRLVLTVDEHSLGAWGKGALMARVVAIIESELSSEKSEDQKISRATIKSARFRHFPD